MTTGKGMTMGSTDELEVNRLTLKRPTISFESITFSDQQTISFNDDEIVVFVGPNNAGKSAALRGLQNWIAHSQIHPVIKGAILKKTGNHDEFRAYLEKNSQKTGDAANVSCGGLGFNIHHSHLQSYPNNMQAVAAFFSGHITTETRITASNPAGVIALYDNPPSHPIHLLMMDSDLEAKISQYFRRAFGKDLFVFRAGGSIFPLYVGENPKKLSGEDALSKSYVDRVLAVAAPLQSQGDGMRSFATVLLSVLVVNNHSIQFLDEPEAFLHPPQARLLDEYIAKERRTESQLFIATHSTDILDGLMVGGPNKIRIIRIQRMGDVNHVKELSKERTAAISSDTLTRYSRVLDGIFYEHVIISESDSDCLFYSSLLRTKTIAGETEPDVLFIHASGKHRMGKLAETLKSLDVPVSVIADLDILNEESAFKNLFEKLGGQWDEISSHWRAIKTSVEEVRPSLTATQVRGLIEVELAKASGVGVFPKQIEKKIGAIFREQSAWDIIKRTGRSGFRSGPAITHFDNLVTKCEAKGLWLVPVGELEGFCRTISAHHGPAFVEKVIEERNLESDEELGEARKFVKRIWEAANVGVVRGGA